LRHGVVYIFENTSREKLLIRFDTIHVHECNRQTGRQTDRQNIHWRGGIRSRRRYSLSFLL